MPKALPVTLSIVVIGKLQVLLLPNYSNILIPLLSISILPLRNAEVDDISTIISCYMILYICITD